MSRFVCVHGHFYQPPRENPWLDAVEVQDSAYPFHDWNQRITAECYAPNAAARVLDREERIERIVNNYARLSFDFGPTLLSWLELHAADTYRAILDADWESRARFGGHGSAMAQAYNHTILPLSGERDRRTQVAWGVRDFEHRFGRPPEGMWLPETAVDVASLEALAEAGIAFTLLAQRQAARVRRKGSEAWQEVPAGGVDPTLPYEVALPSGRRIAVFFYDEAVSHAVAFEGLLADGERFAARLVGGLADARPDAQLAHIATDGETYGHHHRFGEMALAAALDRIEASGAATLTNHAAFLERHPPAHEVEVREGTSWSCAHGVERWRSDCGCGQDASPPPAWRAALRDALDFLRDRLAALFETGARDLVADPWRARDAYVDVVLDRSPACRERFLARQASRPLAAAERVHLLQLLEMQRHALLMFTSCGWFFEDLARIETQQILQYAARAIELAEAAGGERLEEAFVERLAAARSSHAATPTGREVWQKRVVPARIGWEKIGAQWALAAVFDGLPERAQVWGHAAERLELERAEAGKALLATGRATLTAERTQESRALEFAVLHFGDHNFSVGVGPRTDDAAWKALLKRAGEAFSRADLAEVVRLADGHFGRPGWSLQALFRDEQRRLLERVLRDTLAQVEEVHRGVWERHAPLMRFLGDLEVPQPFALRVAAEVVFHGRLRAAFDADSLDAAAIGALLAEARETEVRVDGPGLCLALEAGFERMARCLVDQPSDAALLERLDAMAELLPALPFSVNLWRVQNLFYAMLRGVLPATRARAESGDEAARAWLERARSLGARLRLRVD